MSSRVVATGEARGSPAAPGRARSSKNLVRHLPVAVSVLLYLFLLIRTAWVCDDAYITFRTADNLVSGFGLTWNTAERVQTYTHPLWLLVFSSVFVFTREAFFTSIFLSMAVSLAAVCVFVFRIARDTTSALLGILVFCMSKAFIDYSSSGLENPLTHLILAMFFLVYWKAKSDSRTLLLLSLIAGMGALNRMDTVLLLLPPLAYAYLKVPKLTGLRVVAVGFVPFGVWELFSLFYYGFPFPNTAYAKLDTGIPSGELAGQGFSYLLDSLMTDPLTLSVIAAALAVPLVVKNRAAIPVAVGMGLYLIYVVKIGGDFMTGRFLTAPLFCAVALVSLVRFSSVKRAISTFVVVAGIGLLSPHPPLLSGVDYGQDRGSTLQIIGPAGAEGPFWKNPDVFVGDDGIADERAFYYPFAGLLNASGAEQMPSICWATAGRYVRERKAAVAVVNNIGYAGYFAGPHVHIVDQMALADPLLARLPAKVDPNWRCGHFLRVIPDGYHETLSKRTNLIQDKKLAAFYDKLALITRGDLFDASRLIEIWNMNTGKYNDLVDFDYYRYPFGMQVHHSALMNVKADGTPWDNEGNIIFPERGLLIDLGQDTHARQIEISLDSDDVYLLVYANGPQKHARQVIPEDTRLRRGFKPVRPRTHSAGLKTHRVDVPDDVVEMGYDELRVLPMTGDGHYSIGHIRFLE